MIFLFCRHSWLSANCRYGKFAYRGSCKQKKFWLAVLLNVNQSKKVGGRRSVEELYQALFFVSPVPPECFTKRNENRAWSQVKFKPSWQWKYLGYQCMELSSKLVSAVFPEFHGVASFMVYTLHPTTFRQSGVYICINLSQASPSPVLIENNIKNHKWRRNNANSFYTYISTTFSDLLQGD